MASTLTIPRGFVLLKLGGFSGNKDVHLLPRSEFSTIQGLTKAIMECYNISSLSIQSIKFTIASGNQNVLAFVRQDHWAELCNKEAFNCVNIQESNGNVNFGNVNFYGGHHSKTYIVYLSMGTWPRVF